jgi:ABC-type branched-subunit amino acid transport system substrate-binding protein
MQRFGFVHLEDARSTNVPLLEKILAEHGGQLTVTAAVDRKGPSLNAAAIRTLEASRPDMLIILANNAPLTGFLREYAPRTLILPKTVISFVDREKLLADLGKDAAGIGFSVVVPEYTREKYLVVRDFMVQAKEQKVAVTPVSLEGFITGLALVEGLRHARNDSRVAFIEGMARVAGLDLGYTNLRFSRNERAGSRFVDLSFASRSAGLV